MNYCNETDGVYSRLPGDDIRLSLEEWPVGFRVAATSPTVPTPGKGKGWQVNTWESPVLNHNSPPLPAKDSGITVGNMDQSSSTSENFWASIFPWMFPGQNLRPTPKMQKGNPAPLPQTAPTGPLDAAGRALGIDPASWQTFIRQTLTDWGVYVGLGVLLLLGLVFLVSATGGGSPQVVIQKVGKKVSSGA